MYAFVMSAGLGTRLRPLTYTIPKPMVPVANKPALEHTLVLLKKYGIEDIIINVHFMPEFIQDYFEDGSRWGVRIIYSHEKKLLGTAGGVKKAEEYLKNGTFLIMSGDGLTNIDLKKLISFHKNKKSAVTMALKPVSSRIEYGLTETNKKGRIMRFLEKPTWAETFKGVPVGINTGIYVLESWVLDYMPVGKEFDFAKNVFPLLLGDGKKIFGHYTDEYWCDIGNMTQYREAHNAILEGRASVKIEGRKKGKIWMGSCCKIHPSARFGGSAIIGNNCNIKAKTEISGLTVIGNNLFVDEGAVIKNCIIWDDVHIGKGVRAENCIIAKGTRMKEKISVYDGIIQ